jgi:hypothetical protein
MIEYGKPPLPLNVQRWSQLMRKLGVVKGDNVVSELHQQVFPVVVLEEDRPEHKFAAGERLAWGQYLLAAQGAGIVGYVGLRNPVGSGIIVIVGTAVGGNSTTRRHYIGLARGDTATLRSTEQPRDTRIQPSGAFGVGAPNIAGQIVSARSDTIAVSPFVVGEYLSLIPTLGGGAPVQHNTVLAPGDTVYVWESDGGGGNITNAAMQASFTWRERSLEPGET